MAKRYLALLVGVLLALTASPTLSLQAAPPAQALGCDAFAWLRKRIPPIGNNPVVRVQDGTATISGGRQITVRFCSAGTNLPERQLDRALQLVLAALPRLASAAGTAYLGEDRLLVTYGLQPPDPNICGQVRSDGVMVIESLTDEWMIVHETAHYWANQPLFGDREPWLAEAYAQYLTGQVAPGLAVAYEAWPPDPACAERPLQGWRYDRALPDDCAYSAGRAWFDQLAAKIGPERLRLVLAHAPRELTSQTLLDQLESDGTQLDDLFRHAVFPASMDPLLDQRRALRQQIAVARTSASAYGLALSDHPASLAASWQFAAAAEALAPLQQAIERIAALRANCAQLNMPTCQLATRPETNAPPLAPGSDALEQRLARAEKLLAGYGALQSDAAAFQLMPPTALSAALDHGAADAGNMLQRLSNLIGQIKASEERCKRLGLECPQPWRTAWANNQPDQASALLNALGALLNRYEVIARRCAALQLECQASWKPSLAGSLNAADTALTDLDAALTLAQRLGPVCLRESSCDRIWRDALRESGIAQAKIILVMLGNQVTALKQLEERCQTLAAACRAAWDQALAGGEEAGRVGLNTLDALLTDAAALEQRCAAARWPCPGWREALRQHGLAAAQATMRAADEALPELVRASGALERDSGAASVASGTLAPSLVAARQAFAAGDTEKAQDLVAAARAARWRGPLLLGLGLFGAALFAGVLLILRRRSRRLLRSVAPPTVRQPPTAPSPPFDPNDELLAALLRSTQHKSQSVVAEIDLDSARRHE